MPSASSWGASLLVHACAGVALCLLSGGRSPATQPRPQASAWEVPVMLEWRPEPEQEMPPTVEDEEPLPEPFVVEPLPSVEPAEPPLPKASQDAIVEVPPPEAPEAPSTWAFEAFPPLVASLAVEAEAGTLPPAPSIATPAAPATEGALPRQAPEPYWEAAAEEPRVASARAAVDRPAGEQARTTPDGLGHGPGPFIPATICTGSVPPAYPLAARRRGHEGVVVLRVRVSPTGACLSLVVARSSGHAELDEAALEAVRTWRFAPAVRGGVPVEAELEIPIRFRLTD